MSINSNNNKIREDYKNLLSKKTKLSQIELDDLEIGIFNSSLDYATENKIQLSWQCQQFIEIYTNIARCIYSNLVRKT